MSRAGSDHAIFAANEGGSGVFFNELQVIAVGRASKEESEMRMSQTQTKMWQAIRKICIHRHGVTRTVDSRRSFCMRVSRQFQHRMGAQKMVRHLTDSTIGATQSDVNLIAATKTTYRSTI